MTYKTASICFQQVVARALVKPYSTPSTLLVELGSNTLFQVLIPLIRPNLSFHYPALFSQKRTTQLSQDQVLPLP